MRDSVHALLVEFCLILVTCYHLFYWSPHFFYQTVQFDTDPQFCSSQFEISAMVSPHRLNSSVMGMWGWMYRLVCLSFFFFFLVLLCCYHPWTALLYLDVKLILQILSDSSHEREHAFYPFAHLLFISLIQGSLSSLSKDFLSQK